MKFKVTILVLMGLIGFSLGLKFLSRTENLKQIKINNQAIFVEVANTSETKAQGLSDRKSLNSGRGMLFIFDRPGNYTFWMNRMKFNLDFVFISSEKNERGEFINGKVVDLVENVPFPKQGEEPQVVVSKDIFDKVLEVNQGMIKKLNIKIGDKIFL